MPPAEYLKLGLTPTVPINQAGQDMKKQKLNQKSKKS